VLSSDCFRCCSIGRRYAMDLPDPVSEARRYCRHDEVSVNKCFNERACIGVGLESRPSTSLTEFCKPSRSGGDVNLVGNFSGDRDLEDERSNSSWRGLSIFSGFRFSAGHWRGSVGFGFGFHEEASAREVESLLPITLSFISLILSFPSRLLNLSRVISRRSPHLSAGR
jgi:hypothetical protein